MSVNYFMSRDNDADSQGTQFSPNRVDFFVKDFYNILL